MEKRGYGHEPVVDHLVPRLIGLDRQRERLLTPVTSPPPVIDIVGGRLTGKTLLLDELYEGYRNRIPVARVDLTDPRLLAQPTPGRYAATTSPVVRLLYLLTYLLGRHVPGFGEMPFPRLLLGLLVVSVWHPEHSDDLMPEDLRGAEADLRTFLRRIHHRDPERKRREALAQWLRALTPVLRGVLPALFGLGPGAQHAVRAVIAAVTGHLRASRRHDRAVAWWGERLRADLEFQGDDLQCLFDLARHFPPHGRSLPGAEVLLVRALLADISSYYGPVRRFNRRHPPLILLDNFHSPVGTYVRTPLARAYAATEGVRPVIVVTSLGRSTAEQRSAFVEGPRALATHHPTHVFLTLGIPRIETHVIGEKLLGYRAHSPHLPQVVAGLSGGRAGWASWLARELVPASTGEPPTETTRPHRPSPRDPADEWVDIRARHAPLLPAQVTSTLLERLYPQDEELRRDLTLLSPALDSRSAHALWAELRPPVSAQEATVRMSRVLDEVDADHWRQDRWRWPICDPVGAPHSPGPEVPFVGDRALRALLIAELAHTSSVERWQRIHERLRAAYLAHRPVPDGVRPTIAYLHHTLALADVETVVRALHARLHDTDPAVWLAAVNVICAAPTPPPGLAAAHPEWERQRSQDDLHAAVHDLVTCLWRVSDPLTVTGAKEQDLVKAALRDLYKRLHADVFHDAASQWPQRLAEGFHAPDLPVPYRATRGAEP